VAGRAVTVQLGPADGRVAGRHLCTAAVDAAGPGDVIAIATAGRVDAASWGGLLSLGAVERRVEGVVIDGACRDVDEAVGLGLPVLARAAVPLTARGRIIELAWNVPVSLGGLTVTPGDIIVGDRSGAVFVPRDRADEVFAQALVLAERERHIAAAIKRGTPMTEAMGANYENLRMGR
jgi:regulator of RNase E activity RraA